MTIKPLLTDVFIDGLNFFNGALKGTPYKWLDVRLLAENILPEHNIGRIHYFTAVVQERPPAMGQSARHMVYLRALSAIRDIDIHRGAFRTQYPRLPLADNNPDGRQMARVVRVEEKQTDVNLATYLVGGAFQHEYEQAALISNDADFVGAIRYVRENSGLPVVVLNPNVVRPLRINRQLEQVATYVRNITERHLANSLLPFELTDEHGAITKPPGW